jgi:hypothetical protein
MSAYRRLLERAMDLDQERPGFLRHLDTVYIGSEDDLEREFRRYGEPPLTAAGALLGGPQVELKRVG